MKELTKEEIKKIKIRGVKSAIEKCLGEETIDIDEMIAIYQKDADYNATSKASEKQEKWRRNNKIYLQGYVIGLKFIKDYEEKEREEDELL